MKNLTSGHHKVKRGWKLLAGLPKKRERGSAVRPRRKPSPASRSNSACNRPRKRTLTRTGAPRNTPRRNAPRFAHPCPVRREVVATPCAWWLEHHAELRTPHFLEERSKWKAGRCPSLRGPTRRR